MKDFSTEIAKRTVWGEARGEGEDGMRAVAHVLVNRLYDERWGVTFSLVCLAKLQFSCWDSTDSNRQEIAALSDDDPLLATIEGYLEDALDGALPDPTNGATHYYADSIPPPFWVQGAKLTAHIGHHLFYSGVK